MGAWAYLPWQDNNPTKTAGVITASSADANYPVSNLSLSRISAVWRSTGIVSETIYVDQGSALPVTVAGLLNHNLTSSATVTFKAGASYPPATFSQVITYREFDMFVRFSSQNYRYISYTIADPTNTNGYLEVGLPIAGNLTLPTYNFRMGIDFTDEFNNLTTQTRFGVPNVQALFSRIRLAAQLGPLSMTDGDSFRALYRSLHGNLYTLFLIPDRNVNDGYYGRIVNQLQRTLDVFATMSIQFEEDSRGRAIAA